MKKFLLFMTLLLALCIPWANAQTAPPFSDNFEGTSNWTFENGSQTNQWCIGTATNNGGSGAMYISSDGGSTNSYNNGSNTVVFAFKEFTLPQGICHISYDWNGYGESIYDYMRVYLAPSSASFTAGNLPSGADASSTPTGWIAADGGSRKNTVNDWQSFSADIPVATAGTYKLVFMWRNDGSVGTNPPAAIDNFSISVPSCYTPTGAFASNLTATTVDLSWTAAGANDSVWQYVAVPSGQEPDWSAATLTTTTSCSITGLNPQTTYVLYVRTYCSESDQSDPARVTVRTLCSTAESAEFSEGAEGTTDYALPDCWTMGNLYAPTTGSGSVYTTDPFQTTTSSPCTGSRGFIFRDQKSGVISYLCSQAINFEEVGKYTFRYNYNRASGTGSLGEGLKVMVTPVAGDTTNAIEVIPFVNRCAGNSPIGEIGVNTYEGVINYGGVGYIMIVGYSKYGSSSYFDDLQVLRSPTCFKPTQISASQITPDAALLDWTPARTTDTQWQVEYKIDSVDTWTLFEETAMEHPFLLPGLNANTNYDFRVRTYCDASDQSEWSKASSFRTECAAMTTLPYTCDFENEATGSSSSTATFVDCWRRYNDASSASYKGYPFVAASNAHSGSKSLCFYYSNSTSYPANEIAVLPRLASTIPANTTRVRFWAKFSSDYYDAAIQVGVMTDPTDPSTFKGVKTIKTMSATYQEFIVPLTSYTGTGTYVAIKCPIAKSSASQTIYVDDVTLETVPPCNPVKSVSASNVTRTSMQIDWEEMPGSTNCQGFQVLCTTGNDPATATDTIYTLPNTEHSIALSNLDRETTYNIFVRSICGEDNFSEWVSTSVATKALTGCYDNIVSEGTATNSYVPVYGMYCDAVQKSQSIYPASMLTGLVGKTITELKYYVYSGSSTNWENNTFNVRMMTTTQNNYSASSSYVSTTGATTVYSGYLHASVDGGMNITLSTPFVYTGGNILVEFELPVAAGWTSCSFYGTTVSKASTRAFGSSSPSTQDFLPKVDFVYCEQLDACPAVTDVTVSDIAQTTANVSWTASTGDYANTYDVFYCDSAVADLTTVTPQFDSLTVTSVALTGLTEYHNYYVYVRVNCNAREHNDGSAWTEATQFKTLADCMPATDLTVTPLTKHSAVANWTPFEAQASNFRYLLTTAEVENPQDSTPTATGIAASNTLLTRLNSNTTYHLYLMNDCGSSISPYVHQSFTTPEACSVPANIEIADLQRYQMTINWTGGEFAEAGDNFDMIVSDTAIADLENAQITYPAIAENSKTLTDLLRDTEYHIYLRANCGENGTSAWVDTVVTTSGKAIDCSRGAASIADGTATGYYAPACNSSKYTYTQTLYKQANLGNAGHISSISLQVAAAASAYTPDWTIYLGHTNKASFSSTSDWVPFDNLMQVATVTTPFTTTGWVEIPFDTTFQYNGKDNLVVAIVNNTGATSSTLKFYYKSISYNFLYKTNTSAIDPTNPPTGTRSGYRANMKFGICDVIDFCPTVTAPVASDETNNSARLTWNVGKGDFASSYDVVVSDTAVTDFSKVQPIDSILDTTYTVTGLEPNTLYYAYVRVNCVSEKYNDGSSVWSPAGQFTTQLSCLKPENFVAGNATSRTADLSWTKKGEAQNWVVYAYGYDETDTFNIAATDCTIVADTVTYRLTGLTPAQTYVLQLASVCDTTFSLFADATPYFTTLDTAVGINSFSLASSIELIGNLTLDTANRAYSATLLKGQGIDALPFNCILASSTCTAMVGDVPFTSPFDFSSPVTVRVFAQDTTIHQDWTFTFTEESCATPYALAVSDLQRRSATINWNVGDAAATSFDFVRSDTAVVDLAGVTPQAIVVTNDEGACSYALTGLTRGTHYYIYVRTNCGAQTSQWRAIDFTTPSLFTCDDYVIGSNANYDSYFPVYGMWADADQKTQSIYPASSLTSLVGKTITGMKYFVESGSNSGSWDQSTFKVRMAVATATSVADSFAVADFTEVYSGNLTANTSAGMVVPFDNGKSFTYTGGNLVIEVEQPVGSVYNGVSFYGTEVTGSTVSRVEYNGGSSYSSSFLPKVQFTACAAGNVCPAVTNVTASDVDATTATISWTASTGDYANASDIYVTKTQMTDTTGVVPTQTGITGNSVNLTGLDANSVYYAYVRTHCDAESMNDGVSDWAEGTFTTLPSCRVPESLTATVTGKHTASVVWTNGTGAAQQADNYSFIISRNIELTEDSLKTAPVTASNYTLTYQSLFNLQSDSTYYFYVRRDCDSTDHSAWVGTQFTMPAAMPAVVDLDITDVTAYAFTATWASDTENFANETEWEYALVCDTCEPTAWTTTNVREHFAFGLTPDSTYRFYVRAKNGTAHSDSVWAYVTTEEEPAVCTSFGTSSSTTNYPVTNYNYAYTQMIYPALEGGGNITHLKLQRGSYKYVMNDMKVYIGTTDKTTFASTADWVPAANLTEVYSGSFNKTSEWLDITLTTPYLYDGMSNLVVAISNGCGNASLYQMFKYTSASNTVLSRMDDDDETYAQHPGTAAADQLTYYRTNVEFCVAPESCPVVSNLRVNNITSSSARACWYPGASETTWCVVNSPAKLTAAELALATPDTVNTIQYTINGLNKDTEYYVYVRGNCSATESSRWMEYQYRTNPTCSDPATAVAVSNANNQITFNVTSGQYGTEGTYDYRYWKAGSTDTVTVLGQTSQLVVNDIAGGDVDYYWQVRANCSGADEGSSNWINGNTFHVCGVVYVDETHPYVWDFESTPFVSSCWMNYHFAGSSTSIWRMTNYVYHSGLYSAELPDQQIGNLTHLVLPVFNIPAADEYEFKFWVYRSSYSTSKSNEGVRVLVNTANDTTGATELMYIRREYTLGDNVETSTGWYQYSAPIPTSGNIYVILQGVSEYGSATYIDDIEVSKRRTYNVSYSAAPAALGTLEVAYKAVDTLSAGVFYGGAKPVFTATPNTGMEFVNWTNANGDVLSTANPWTVAVSQDTAIIANFDTASYDLNVVVAPGYNVYGSVSGSGTYRYMSNQVFQAQPISHYHAVWSDGVSGNTRSIVMPAHDTTFVATFALDKHSLTVQMNDSTKGSVTGTGVYDYETKVTVTATPLDEHRLFTGWSNGETNATIVIDLKSDSVITANFMWDTHTISTTVNDATMGSVAGAGTYSHDSIATLTATPAAHHIFVNWNGVDSLTNPVLNHYVDADSTINANFDWDSHDITVLINDSVMGTVTGTGNYYHGTTATVTATANDHYHFVQWSNGLTTPTFNIVADTDSVVTAIFAIDQHLITGLPVDTARGRVFGTGYYDYGSYATLTAEGIYPYQFSRWDDEDLTENDTLVVQVLGDETYTAYFKYNEFDIITRVNDQSMGTVLGGGSFVYDTIVDLTAVPAANHHFMHWNNGSTSPVVSHVVKKDTIITATFGIDTFKITAIPNSVVMGTVTGGDLYPYGATVNITSAPAPHYHFLGWSNGEQGANLSWNVTEDSLVIANFAIDMHTVTVAANDANLGTVTGSGLYDYGTQVAITATPANSHCSFVQWSNGDLNATTTIDLAGDTTVTAIFAVDSHDVTLYMNGAGMGNVTGAGNYVHGQTAVITATPNDHYHFLGWSNGVTTETANILIDRDTTITANFAIDEHNVNALVNVPAMGATTGSGIYNYGADVDVTAIPAAHYHFVQWSNGVTTPTNRIKVVGDTTVVAIFGIDQHNVTVNANDNTYGSVTGSGVYNYGTQVTITATPADEHYSFVQWSNGLTTPTAVIDLDHDTTVTAIFAMDSHNVTLNVNNPAMGTVSGAGTFAHGATAAINATPAAHHHFVNWSNGITNAAANIVVDRDSVITANFAIDEHNVVAVSNDPAKGTVTGGGMHNYGDNAILVATAAPHAHFVQWSNGVTTANYTLNVAGDTTVIATFATDLHNVTAVANDGSMGSVTGSGAYEYGTHVTLVATPANEHYTFVGWSNGATTATTNITVTGDVTMTAYFAIDNHNVTLNVNNPAMGAVTGAGTYAHGTNVAIAAIPNAHYHFVDWSNGNNGANATIYVVSDTALTANFAIDQHDVSVIVNAAGMGTVSGTGTFNYGASTTLVATPAANYHFVGWSNGVTNPILNIVVTGDTSLTANFAINQHNVTVLTNDANLGTVSGSGLYNYGAQVVITATAAPNCAFTGWSNGVTTPTAVINVDRDTTVTATFVRNQYVITLYANDDNMGSVTGAGNYIYGDVATLTATPADDCHRFVRWSDGNTDNPRAYTVTGTKSLTAIFAINNYTISVASSNTAAGTAYCDNSGSHVAMMNVNCGTLVEIHAEAAQYYRFVEWSDGVTDAVRNVVATSDSDLVALFEPICGDNADLPVVFLYNGLIMLDLDSVKARGFNPSANDVTWYQVVGDADAIDAAFPADDQFICSGYYLSLPTNSLGYGEYYAVVDVSGTPEAICHDKMRSVIVSYTSDASKTRVEMAPTNVKNGDVMTITGLMPEERTTIMVYDYTGKAVQVLETEGLSTYDIKACGAAGVYMVKVTSDSVNETLRFIVSK